MEKQLKIYVAGHRGMVGSAIVRAAAGARPRTATSSPAPTPSSTSPTRPPCAPSWPAEKPDQVYLAAAKVGGIHANNTYPADFIYDNLMIEANVIHAAFQRRRAESCCSSAPAASTPSSPRSR